jgi:hypothetical protein
MPFGRHDSAESTERFGHRATATFRARQCILQRIVHFAGACLLSSALNAVILDARRVSALVDSA